MRTRSEQGIALIITLLVMMLTSALLVGFTAVIMSDQRYRFIDRDRGQAFYAASGGVEKLTADIGNVFFTNVAPTTAQLTALTPDPKKPVIEGITYVAPMTAAVLPTSSLTKCSSPNTITTVGSNGYTIKFCAAPSGQPTSTSTTPIKSGPYEGLIALQTPYQIDVSAKTTGGGESHLVRTIESVAIPVFQFGMFSDVDLSFFAGPDFNFGGRVHTNGNLFLAQGDDATLKLSDKVTAVKDVVRKRLQNGAALNTSDHEGTISMAKAPGSYRNLAAGEGSVTDGVGSAANEPTWHTISLSTYNSWIRSGTTGAKTLSLPLVTAGGSNPDLARRPVANEDADHPILYGERLYTKASLRILLSDLSTDITSLPGITGAAPVPLDGNWRTTPPNNGTAYGSGAGVDSSHPPIARTPLNGAVSATTSVAVVASSPPFPVVLRTITLTAAVPAAWQMPYIVVNKNTAPTASYTLTCTGKTASSFTGCISPTTPVSPAISYNVTPKFTVSATVPTIDYPIFVGGPAVQLLANMVAGSTNGAGQTVTVTASSTLPFSVNTFWAAGNLITCSGYDSRPSAAVYQLTGCAVPADIPAGTTITSAAASSAGTGTIGGYIKIEKQAANGTWSDVTMEILNYGIGGPNIVDDPTPADANVGPNNGGTACVDPTPNAIIRIQRLRDNNWSSCTYSGSVTSSDYWPNVLYDAREALQRDTSPGSAVFNLGGVMHYITLDTANLSKWLLGLNSFAAGTGVGSKTDNGGYTVYFSDRRNNRNASSQETAEYGWEDFVNPASGTGAPNGSLNTGEDVNGNGTLDVYGGVPNYYGVYNTAPPGAVSPLTTSATPITTLARGVAQTNRAILFRRALKLTNGSGIRGLGVTGLTVVSENPVYVQGDWNANPGGAGGFTGAHAATAVIADAVTLLSTAWNDNESFRVPYSPGSRVRNTSWYRMAIIGGKGIAFPEPGGSGTTDFGTDGGAHNFLRYLESGQTVNYSGSIATFYYNRQALGVYKCCDTVYGAPTRMYAFDVDFLNPALLPPNTPVFRDINTVGFAQEIRPGR